MSPAHQTVTTVGDLAAATITIAAVLKWLPGIAAAFSIVWTGLRIYEMVTGKAAADLFKRKP
jgi:hypothetical protein